MADKTPKGPTWGYKKADNADGYVSKLFPNGLEKGWSDTPAKIVKND